MMKEFISEHGKIAESDLMTVAKSYLCNECTVYAVHTNYFYCGSELNIDIKHLVELRIFTADMEFKAFRLNIGNDFTWRYINDSKFKQVLSNEPDDFLCKFSNRTYDEEHYLDIDSTKSIGTCYITTGGGKYELPVENAEKIKIRNYLEYDENGIVIISDFRIVGFIQKGSAGNV